MRRRLVLSYGALLLTVLFSLVIPLVTISVDHDSQRLTVDRLADAAYLVELAEPALHTEESAALRTALVRYKDVHDIHSAVIDVDRRVVVTSDATGRFFGPTASEARSVGKPGVTAAIRRALAGEQVGFDTRVWPWGPRWLVVAVPVGSGGEVSGAVVTVSPTERLRSATWRNWLVLAALSMIPLALCAFAANRLAHWTLRPVGRLDRAARALASGGNTVRVPEGTGPPELRHLETVFNHMADTVTEALARQRAFVAQASHQMRNPLTALLLRLEPLGDEELSDEGRTNHRLAVEEVERLGKMLEGLLALARVERGDDPMETVDAVEVAAARVRAWCPLAIARGITLTADTTESAVPVHSVLSGLDQVLDALIDNALKFGARTVTVRVTGGDNPQVHVVDDGPGLAPEDYARATERFWRAGNSQNYEGHGLGLTIAAALTESSGGVLTVADAEGGGLHARIDLRAA